MNTLKFSLLTAVGGLALGSILASNAAHADASYQESTQITGGSLADSLRSIPFMRSQLQKMFDPVTSLTLLQGNRLATVSAHSTQIIDLDQESVTHIDNDKKTYSVVTFAQMRQAFKDAPQKIAEAQQRAQAAQQNMQQPQQNAPHLEVTYDVSAQDPGGSKLVNGFTATEHLITLKAHITNLDAAPTDPARTITYSITSDSWCTPEPVQLRQIHEFYVRYGKALMKGVDATALMKSVQPTVSRASLGAMFGSNQSMGAAFGEMSKRMVEEQQKRRGTIEVLTILRMGGEAMVATPGTGTVASATAASSSSSNSMSQVANQVASNTATEVAADQTSKLGMFGSVLGRNVLGAFHRGSSSSSSSNTSAASAASSASLANAVLFESTSQKSQFSVETISADAFQVPAGYTKVQTLLGPG